MPQNYVSQRCVPFPPADWPMSLDKGTEHVGFQYTTDKHYFNQSKHIRMKEKEIHFTAFNF